MLPMKPAYILKVQDDDAYRRHGKIKIAIMLLLRLAKKHRQRSKVRTDRGKFSSGGLPPKESLAERNAQFFERLQILAGFDPLHDDLCFEAFHHSQ